MGSDDDDHDHHTHDLNFSHKATLAAVSSLFAVTLFIIFVFLYMKHRQNRRQRRRRVDFVSRLITAHNAAAHDLDHSSHKNAVGGLDQTVINSLPEFVYKQSGSGGGGGEAVECSVCLSAVTEEAKVRLLPNCGHVFHVDCVDMWLGSHTTCPLCRAEVKPRVEPMDQQPEPSGGGDTAPTAPPVDEMSLLHGEAAAQAAENKPTGSSGGSRLSSFRRMLSRERLSTRSLEGCGDQVSSSSHHDLERQ